IMTMHLRVPPPKPSSLWPEIPPALEHLLLAMLSKQPEKRPTMLEVVRRLAAIGEELERKRAAEIAAIAPPLGPAGFATGSCPPRIMTIGLPEAAKAFDPLAWRYQPSKRWQFLLGIAALVGSTLLFLASHDEAPAAVASTPRPAAVEAPVPELPAHEPAPEMPPQYAIEAGVPTSGATTQPRPKAVPRASTRKASAVPRRPHGTLDPDGTIDPYP
ncbi:MAG: hypothetical protein SFX73_28275, partial [Kofleriaceae bacterium]|nr:hypothetical protein [Kofleriaceae bacterium]